MTTDSLLQSRIDGMKWSKDKYDSRDYLHAKLYKVPDVVTWDKFIPDVRDQGNVGSCTGFGIGGQLTYLAKKLGVYTEWFSPTWIYNGARFIEGTLTEDDGAYPRDCLEWLRKKGCLLEHFWPYRNVLDTQCPPSSFDVEAAKYPQSAYYRVTGDADGICSSIAAGHVVSIGTPWYYKWMDIGVSGKLPVVSFSDSIAGGHMTYLYGYDKPNQLFFGSNSWGTSWGNNGHYLMPFSSFPVFKQVGGYDAYYIQVNWGSKPDPTPSSSPLIRLRESRDSGKTWVNLYRSSAFVHAPRSSSIIIRLEESRDNGKSWLRLYNGTLYRKLIRFISSFKSGKKR